MFGGITSYFEGVSVGSSPTLTLQIDGTSVSQLEKILDPGP